MVNTTRNAFDEFMRNVVNLDVESMDIARNSRNNLINNIHKFEGNDNFFRLYSCMDIFFGSFARKTKIRPLDDIDIMLCLSADGSTYIDYFDKIELLVHNRESPLYQLSNENSVLNSTRVINRLISELKLLHDYRSSDIHKCGEAATLQLKSYTWNFDIVPCFFTTPEYDGRTYYLIPDGKGNWKKTDPRKDRDNISTINQHQNGLVLNTIRLIKYWNKRPTMPSIPSYVLESLLLTYFSSITPGNLDSRVHIRFRDALRYVANAIYYPINDPKKIQGNLNTLNSDEKKKISDRAFQDYGRACDAISFEDQKDYRASINKWRDILGDAFPRYTE